MVMIAHVSSGAPLRSLDEVIVRLREVHTSGFYWKPEDLLWQFEEDLRQLLYRAGLRGTFEAKQTGRRERGVGQEGITLGLTHDFVVEVHAEYGWQNVGRADVWTINLGVKDTRPARERLVRALLGEVLSPTEPPETTSQAESQEEGAGEVPEKQYLKGSLIQREPLVVAHCIVFAWGEACDKGYISKSDFTNIVVERLEATDKRKATAAHKSVVAQGYLSPVGVSEYRFTDRAQGFVSEHREELLASPGFQEKMRVLEERLLHGNPRTAQKAQRRLARIRAFLEIALVLPARGKI